MQINLRPIKPIWTYSVQLWGTASNSNIEIIQRSQNKYLNVPWYVTSDTLHHDLNVRTLETRLKSSVGDTPTDWSNTRIKKKTTSRLVYINYNL